MSISEPLVAETDTEVKEIVFRGGLPGFAGRERFALVQWGKASPFSLLRSLEEEALSFVVMPPALFFPDYEPTVSDDTATEIGATSAEDVMLLVIVTVKQPVSESTANLLGPLVINVHDLRGAQAVLDPDRYSPVTPLAPSAPAPAAEAD